MTMFIVLGVYMTISTIVFTVLFYKLASAQKLASQKAEVILENIIGMVSRQDTLEHELRSIGQCSGENSESISEILNSIIRDRKTEANFRNSYSPRVLNLEQMVRELNNLYLRVEYKLTENKEMENNNE